MKRLLGVLVVLLLVLPGLCSAQERALSAKYGDFRLGPSDISGDIGFLWVGSGGRASFSPGVGLDLVDYKEGLVKGRAQGFFQSTSTGAEEEATILGASVLVNIPKLLGMAPGTSWIAQALNPSLGAFVGYDTVSGKPAYGPMLSIINVAF